VHRVLRELRQAQEALAAPGQGPLRISALHSFTESWLVPHLADFERVHPEIELCVEATLRYADFERDPSTSRFDSEPVHGASCTASRSSS
jgi:DNA-binding transcriptional LysR family regulator